MERNRRMIITKSVVTGMRNCMLRSRVIKLDQREALLVAITEHLTMMDQHRSYKKNEHGIPF